MTIGWVEVNRDEFKAVHDHMRDSLKIEQFRDMARMQDVMVYRDGKSNIPVLRLTTSDLVDVIKTQYCINGVFYDGDSKTD